MEIKTDIRNELFKRNEIKVVVEAEKNPTFDEAKKMIVEQTGKPEENLDVYGVKGRFGSTSFEISAYVYDFKEDLEKAVQKTKKQRVEEAKKADEEAKKVEEAKKADEEAKKVEEAKKTDEEAKKVEGEVKVEVPAESKVSVEDGAQSEDIPEQVEEKSEEKPTEAPAEDKSEEEAKAVKEEKQKEDEAKEN